MPLLTARLARLTLAAPISRAAGVQAPRNFATSAAARKSATESVKGGLKTVDRAVSDNLVVPGLDAAIKVKETAETITKGKAKGKAEELQGKAKGAVHEAAGKAKGAAEEAKKKL